MQFSKAKATTSTIAAEDVEMTLVSDGVPTEQRTMAIDKVFWPHCGTNLAPAGWVLGAVVAGLGMDLRAGIVAVILGNMLGALPVALCSTIGPQTGLTQIEISRWSFGRLGTRIPASLNWLMAVGWDAVNNVPSALAVMALGVFIGFAVPFWCALIALAAMQLAVGMYGHHLVQVVNKYLGIVLFVVFTGTGIVAVLHHGPGPTQATFVPATFVLAVSLAAGYTIGFAPFSSDYTRYLPPATPRLPVALLSFSGLCSSGVVMEFFGLLTASHLGDLSPAGFISGIASMLGPFGWVTLAAIALSAVSINSTNANTAAYSLMSMGIRVPRHVSAVVTSACGFVLAIIGAGSFAELFSNYMVVILYWISPWAGIVIADWFFGQSNAHPVNAKWRVGAWVFVIVTPLTIALFSSTSVYIGPVARLLSGTDIGYFVGFFSAFLAYAMLSRLNERRTVTIKAASV